MSMKNEETETGHIGALLRKLVQLHVPAESVDSVVPAATRLLESSLGTAPSLQSADALTKSMLFRLVRDRKHEESSRLATVTSSLKFQRGIPANTLWPILYVLHDLSGSSTEDSAKASSNALNNGVSKENCRGSVSLHPSAEIGRASEGDRSNFTTGHEHSRSLGRVSANPFMPGEENLPEQMDPVVHTSDEENGNLFANDEQHLRNELGALQQVPSHVQTVRLQNKSIEKKLVQDLLLIVQGEDGALLSFSTDKDDECIRFHLPSKTEISLAARDMVLYVSELGFLFRVIRTRIKEGQIQNQDEAEHGKVDSGQVSENMYRGILREMDTYYRSLMTLRGMNCISSNDEDESPGTLTLRKVFVWADREKPRLRWLARLCEEARNLEGGQILALLRKRRGSYVLDDIRDMISRILAYAAAPINRMLLRWLAEGELVDEHGEFYIKEDPKVAATMAPTYSGSTLVEESNMSSGLAGVVNMASLASHRIWWGLFKMRKEMLPGAVNADLAQKTLIAGKSVAFLRRCCGDSPWVDRVHAPLVASLTATGKKLFEADYKFDRDAVREVIEKAKESACMRLKELFFDKFDLSHHFGAIKRYLLLSQGDFAQALMDGLAPILDGDGNMVRSTLTGSVDAALQGCSSFNEETDEDILERLDVQIVSEAHDPGSSLIGWDVFSLTYRVQDAPLNTVFSEKVMEAYLLIFRFLWKLKRMDHLMTTAFLNLRNAEETKRSTIVGVREDDRVDERFEVREVLKRAHHLRMKMTHVVHNLQHYCTVEVLEGSWAVLEREMISAEDLDGMIQAHAKYLTVIKDRTLLSDRSKYVAAELDGVLRTIPLFSEVQSEICVWANAVASHERSAEDDTRGALLEKLSGIEEGFDDGFRKLLKALSNHTRMVETCVFLLFRLDFNRYYARRLEGVHNIENDD